MAPQPTQLQEVQKQDKCKIKRKTGGKGNRQN